MHACCKQFDFLWFRHVHFCCWTGCGREMSADWLFSQLALLDGAAFEKFAADLKDFKDLAVADEAATASFISQVSNLCADEEWPNALKANLSSLTVESVRASRQAYDDQRRESEAAAAAAAAAAAGGAPPNDMNTSVLDAVDESMMDLKTIGMNQKDSKAPTPIGTPTHSGSGSGSNGNGSGASAAAAASSAPPPSAAAAADAEAIDPNAIREKNLPPLPPTQQTYTVFITNLNVDASENDVREVFKSCPDLYEVFVVRDKANGTSKGFGFLHFLTDTGRNAALRLTPAVIKARPAKLYTADNKNNVFIGNVPPTYSEPALKAKLEEMTGTVMKDLKKNEKGFAFAQFYSYRQAEIALQKLANATLEGRPLTAQAAKNKKTDPPMTGGAPKSFGAPNPAASAAEGVSITDGVTLFVRNIGQTSEHTLRAKFQTCGPVRSIRIAKTENGENKGFAFVEYEQTASAQHAFQTLNNSSIQSPNGQRTITLQFQKTPHRNNPSGGGGSGGGGRGAAPAGPPRISAPMSGGSTARPVYPPTTYAPRPQPTPQPVVPMHHYPTHQPPPTHTTHAPLSFAHHARPPIGTPVPMPVPVPQRPPVPTQPPVYATAPITGLQTRPVAPVRPISRPPAAPTLRIGAPHASVTYAQPTPAPTYHQPYTTAPQTVYSAPGAPAPAQYYHQPAPTPAPAPAPAVQYVDQYGRPITLAPAPTPAPAPRPAPPPPPAPAQPRYTTVPIYAPAQEKTPVMYQTQPPRTVIQSRPPQPAAPPPVAVTAVATAPAPSQPAFEVPTMALDERTGQYVLLTPQQQWQLQQQFMAGQTTLIDANGEPVTSTGRSRRARSSRSRSPSPSESRDRSRSRERSKKSKRHR